jgi:DNA invertase Pin-like site-specific DNA recombinase
VEVEFFDEGCSRRLPWSSRPQAAALLAELSSPQRRFDAVVVGEYERAFSGDEFAAVTALFERAGVQMWLPEAGGRWEREDPVAQALVMVLGAQSQREVLRSRHRVLAAMRAQAREQGRYLGGRPPYGYRLVDAGPHPSRAHARWGRRLQRLEPDPATGPHVQWMFAQRLAGRSIAGIARELTERGVPCPSGVDPQRNRHRDGGAWTLRTVAVILSNPRYTGRQVWGRQQHVGRRTESPGERSRSAGEWAVSVRPAHPALVSEPEFIAAQHIRAARQTRDGRARSYLLSGLVRCGACGRRMDSHWVHGRAGYRCRHGHSSSRPRAADGLKYLYVREDLLVRELVGRLAGRPAVPNVDQVWRSDVASALATVRAERLLIVHDGRSWDLTTRQ